MWITAIRTALNFTPHTPTQLLLSDIHLYCKQSITVWQLFAHKHPLLCSLHIAKWTRPMWAKLNCPRFKTTTREFECGNSQPRIVCTNHCATELQMLQRQFLILIKARCQLLSLIFLFNITFLWRQLACWRFPACQFVFSYFIKLGLTFVI